MAQRSIARRYVAAVLEVADRAGLVDETLNELDFASQVISGLGDVKELLLGEAGEPGRFRTMIDEAFTRAGASPVIRGLLAVLCENNRLSLLPDVRAEYGRMLDERSARAEAVVFTAQPLEEDDLSLLAEALRSRTGKQVRLSVEREASLLGGVRVRLGNTLYDGSVRGKLESLLRKFE